MYSINADVHVTSLSHAEDWGVAVSDILESILACHVINECIVKVMTSQLCWTTLSRLWICLSLAVNFKSYGFVSELIADGFVSELIADIEVLGLCF